MTLKRLFLLLAALGALLLVNTNCTVVYSGCSEDSDCDTAAGEVCISVSGTGECGLPKQGCVEGDEINCPPVGECAGQVQQCLAGRYLDCTPEMDGTYPEACADASMVNPEAICRRPEVCDGLDNDCNGVVDNGVPGVGDICTVGVGVCEAVGQLFCNAGGEQICNATEKQPQTPSCDCDDDDCDSIVNDFEITATNVTTASVAGSSEWSMAMVGDAAFGAVQNSDSVSIYSIDDDAQIATLANARQAKLFGSELNDNLIVLFVRSDMASPELTTDEIFLATYSLDGSQERLECVTCDDIARASRGSVIGFDADFVTPGSTGSSISDASCPIDAPLANSCRYVVGFVRGGTNEVATLLMAADSLQVFERSLGLILNFNNNNTGVVAVDVEATSGLAYILLERMSDVSMVLVQGIDADEGGNGGRSQWLRFGTIESMLAGGVDYDYAILDDAVDGSLEPIVALLNGGELTVARYVPNETTRSFDEAFKVTIEPIDTSALSVSNPQIEAVCFRANTPAEQAKPRYALLTYEVSTSTGTSVEAVMLDRGTGEVVSAAPDAVGGASPLLAKDGLGELVFGVIAEGTGAAELPLAGNGSPAITSIICDGI